MTYYIPKTVLNVSNGALQLSGVNLLLNPGFEEWSSGTSFGEWTHNTGFHPICDNWFYDSTDNAQGSPYTQGYNSGYAVISKETVTVDGSNSKAALLMSAGPSNGGHYYCSAIFQPIVNWQDFIGQTITFSARIMGGGGVGDRVALDWGSGSAASSFITASGVYTTVSVTATIPSTATYLRCYIGYAQSGNGSGPFGCNTNPGWRCDNATLVLGSVPLAYSSGALAPQQAIQPNVSLASTVTVPDALVFVNQNNNAFNGVSTANFADNLAAFSVSFWMKSTSTNGFIIGKCSQTGGSSPEVGWAVKMVNGTIQVQLWQDTANLNQTATTTTVNDGNWHHICTTIIQPYNVSTATNIYIDGVLQTTTNNIFGSPTTIANSYNVTIGQNSNLHNYDTFYTGLISDITIWGTALDRVANGQTQAPITTLSQFGNYPAPGINGLLAWWKLNESSGTTITDSSGNSRNGTFAVTSPVSISWYAPNVTSSVAGNLTLLPGSNITMSQLGQGIQISSFQPAAAAIVQIVQATLGSNTVIPAGTSAAALSANITMHSVTNKLLIFSCNEFDVGGGDVAFYHSGPGLVNQTVIGTRDNFGSSLQSITLIDICTPGTITPNQTYSLNVNAANASGNVNYPTNNNWRNNLYLVEFVG